MHKVDQSKLMLFVAHQNKYQQSSSWALHAKETTIQAAGLQKLQIKAHFGHNDAM